MLREPHTDRDRENKKKRNKTNKHVERRYERNENKTTRGKQKYTHRETKKKERRTNAEETTVRTEVNYSKHLKENQKKKIRMRKY